MAGLPPTAMYRSGEISINPSPERLCGLFLETLTFVCPVFLNPPIDGALWLTFLQKLSCGHSFNQPVVGIAWPASRQHVSLGLQRGSCGWRPSNGCHSETISIGLSSGRSGRTLCSGHHWDTISTNLSSEWTGRPLCTSSAIGNFNRGLLPG